MGLPPFTMLRIVPRKHPPPLRGSNVPGEAGFLVEELSRLVEPHLLDLGGAGRAGGGGGGACRLGGALFIGTGANVTVTNVTLQGNAAHGGDGGNTINCCGAGGGGSYWPILSNGNDGGFFGGGGGGGADRRGRAQPTHWNLLAGLAEVEGPDGVTQTRLVAVSAGLAKAAAAAQKGLVAREGGFLAGNGGGAYGGGAYGGGGAGLGGAIFIQKGGTLKLGGTLAISENVVKGGNGGVAMGAGSGVF